MGEWELHLVRHRLFAAAVIESGACVECSYFLEAMATSYLPLW